METNSTPRNNYAPWHVHPDELWEAIAEQDKLEELVRFAILAPSSHNSQPWHFAVKGSSIVVTLDSTRLLPVSDSANRQAMISIGCAIESLVIAASYYGWNVTVSLPKPFEAHLSFVKERAAKDPHHLIHVIGQRRTNRGEYAMTGLSDDALRSFSASAPEGAKERYFSEQKTKEAVAHIALDAMLAFMSSVPFRQELSQYVKSNVTRSPVGIPAFGMGVPTLPSLIAPALVRNVNMGKLTKPKDQDLLINHTPALGIIWTPTDTSLCWLNAGRRYMHIALVAYRDRIDTAVWAAPIESPEHRTQLTRYISDRGQYPQLYFRIGQSRTSVEHSPRLAVEQVIERVC